MEQNILLDNISTLDFVNFQIAELLDIKKKLEDKIINGLKHDYEGSKTYELSKYKVMIKTDYIYSLDKTKYKSLKNDLNLKFNPIKESISYSIDKKMIKEAELYATPQELLILSELITKSPAKACVKVLANV